ALNFATAIEESMTTPPTPPPAETSEPNVPDPQDGPELKPWIRINPPVFISSVVLTVAFLLFAVLAPETAAGLFDATQAWILDTAGWFYVLSVAFFLIFVIYLAASKFGAIKLGP